METETEPSLLSLPTEMLDKVFSYLKTRDMDSIRRVNRQFNEIANQPIYNENEFFYWPNGINPRRIIELLNDSKRSVFNLRINGVVFQDDFVLTFFEKHGSEVHSLSFSYCNFRRGLLQDIILQCKAMRSFSYIDSGIWRFQLLDDFRKFETQSIVLEEVTSLTFVLERLLPIDMDDIEPTLRRFMSIFPNVTRLDIRIPNSPSLYRKSKFNSPYYDSESDNSSGTCEICATKNEMKSAAIYNSILHMRKTLKWLRTNLSPDFLSEIGASFFVALPNLIHLSLDFELFRVGEMDIRKWRNLLRSIPWIEIVNSEISMANLVQQLNPKHLVLDACMPMPGVPGTDSNFFLEVLQSKMQTLEFTHTNDWPADRTSFLNLRNTTLTDLTILEDVFVKPFTAVALFPKHFTALVHLRLGMASNEILQIIFQNQKNLRSLYLDNCRECDLYGFTGAKNEKQLSIRELQNLEHLTMRGFDALMLKSRYFTDAFQFPRLKYLNIEADYYFTWKGSSTHICSSLRIPMTLFKSMTNLEALRLSNLGRASFRELKTLCQNLKNLRYLNYDCSEIYRRIRGVCIVDLSESTFKDLHLRDELCYYDEIIKKTVLTNKCSSRTLFSPKISSFVIKWIKF